MSTTNPGVLNNNNEGHGGSSNNGEGREREEQWRVEKGNGKVPVEQRDDDDDKTEEQAAARWETQPKIAEIDEEVVQRLGECSSFVLNFRVPMPEGNEGGGGENEVNDENNSDWEVEKERSAWLLVPGRPRLATRVHSAAVHALSSSRSHLRAGGRSLMVHEVAGTLWDLCSFTTRITEVPEEVGLTARCTDPAGSLYFNVLTGASAKKMENTPCQHILMLEDDVSPPPEPWKRCWEKTKMQRTIVVKKWRIAEDVIQIADSDSDVDAVGEVEERTGPGVGGNDVTDVVHPQLPNVGLDSREISNVAIAEELFPEDEDVVIRAPEHEQRALEVMNVPGDGTRGYWSARVGAGDRCNVGCGRDCAGQGGGDPGQGGAHGGLALTYQMLAVPIGPPRCSRCTHLPQL
ncbi:hypothetical protein B0H14DRAFT_2635937 [Mycena olivaceomarginata]|nr:hypothetical protein B0H14DRAFT_2635937 [Mycena olivaceomarginata]